MEQNAEHANLWNSAGKAGLVLGAVSTVYLFVTQLISQTDIPVVAATLTNGVLWICKFAGCIWLMSYFMKRQVSVHKVSDRSKIFRFGMLTSLLSALVYAIFTYANITVISPDLFDTQMDQILQMYAPMLDSNTMNQVDDMLEIMPQMTFFSNLIYCFLYGTSVSFILSRNIPSKDPFADYRPDEQ